MRSKISYPFSLSLSSILASVLGSLALNACATSSEGSSTAGDPDNRREIVALEDMSLEYIQTLWGAPDQNVPAGKGRTVRFKNIRAEDEDPISGTVTVKFCDVKLEINDKDLVQTWNYEVCRPKK